MAKTRKPLQLDDLTEGDLVDFIRINNVVTTGIYRGLLRWDCGVWLIRVEDAEGEIFGFAASALRRVKILKAVGEQT